MDAIIARIEREIRQRHLREQLWRFIRLFWWSLVVQAIALQGQHWSRSTIISVVFAAGETAFRQFRPTVSATSAAETAGAAAALGQTPPPSGPSGPGQ